VELLAQEMWNAEMIPALRSGTADIAIALCPELAPDVADEVIRTEPVVAVLPRITHSRARTESRSVRLPRRRSCSLPAISRPAFTTC
jgi:DNA-binding transcriptional LysR family regulator